MSLEAIRRSCWNGSIPVCFQLASKDLASSEAQVPLYVMCSRLSYFPLMFDRLKSHFLGVAPAALDEIWLESEQGPLKWHLPVGVLYDLHGRNALPWVINVNFTGFPEDRLLRLSGLETLKTSFMSSLKEANFLKHGHGNLVMGLSRQDQDNLWLGIIAGESGFSSFWTASNKLMADASHLKSCAVRLLRAGAETSFVQLPIPPLQEDGSQTTLGQALQVLGIKPEERVRAKVQGVVVPEDAVMWDLQTSVCHGDGWVYVVTEKE